MNTVYFVDRIEGNTMVVINKQTNETLEVPHALAPELSEGDAFSIRSEPTVKQSQLDEAKERLERLKSRSPQPTSGNPFDL